MQPRRCARDESEQQHSCSIWLSQQAQVGKSSYQFRSLWKQFICRRDQNEAEIPADLNQKIVFKKRQLKKKAEEDNVDDNAGGYDVDKGRPAQQKKDSKKMKKSTRPTLSFNEEEEDEWNVRIDIGD